MTCALAFAPVASQGFRALTFMMLRMAFESPCASLSARQRSMRPVTILRTPAHTLTEMSPSFSLHLHHSLADWHPSWHATLTEIDIRGSQEYVLASSAWQRHEGCKTYCGTVPSRRLPISLDYTLYCCLPSCIIGPQHTHCACTEWQQASALLGQGSHRPMKS